MTWRRRLKRRLLWAGVLLGLVLLLCTLSVVRVGMWACDSIWRTSALDRRQRALAY